MLEEILEQKLRAKSIEKEIKTLEEDAGLPDLRKQLKAAQTTLEAMLAEAVLKEVMEEGTLRIVSAGRLMRVIRVSDFRVQYPDLFEEYANVPITPVVDALIQQKVDDGMSKRDAKANTEEELSSVIDVHQTEKWDILDLAGEPSGADH